MNFAIGLSAAAHCPCWSRALAIAVIANIISIIFLNRLTVNGFSFSLSQYDIRALSVPKQIVHRYSVSHRTCIVPPRSNRRSSVPTHRVSCVKRFSMRPHGKAKLGFFPLLPTEAERLRNCLTFPDEFSAVDPCVGDGVAFTYLVDGTHARRYGIEIDAYRAGQSRSLGIETVHANTMDVRCPADSISLLYV